jgi:hypothetical protein
VQHALPIEEVGATALGLRALSQEISIAYLPVKPDNFAIRFYAKVCQKTESEAARDAASREDDNEHESIKGD